MACACVIARNLKQCIRNNKIKDAIKPEYVSLSVLLLFLSPRGVVELEHLTVTKASTLINLSFRPLAG